MEAISAENQKTFAARVHYTCVVIFRITQNTRY